MVLIRVITLEGLIHNVKIKAKYIKSKLNRRVDALSRKKFDLFRALAPNARSKLEEIPSDLWPLARIWLRD